MKVLVTGGVAFRGSHIVYALTADGHQVAVIGDLSTGSESNMNQRAEFHRVGLTDFDATGTVFASVKPQFVSHLGAQTSLRLSIKNPVYDVTVNVLGSINVPR